MSARRSAQRNSLYIAAIGAIALIGPPLVGAFLPPAEQPPTYSCIESYDKAIEMYEENGVWLPLPEDSPEEIQCDVNDRMIEQYDLGTIGPEYGGSTGDF